MRSPRAKVKTESSTFVERIQGDICRSIFPPYGPFIYFIVLIDAPMCLLPTSSLSFARVLAYIVSLQAQFIEYAIKAICFDNPGEFTNQNFLVCIVCL